MTHYYNEIDPVAANWLRVLIMQGHLPDGVVDERSIEDVQPDDLRDFTQCHFFAGIGGWAYAARLAGWSDDRPLWTGSCPCQPFSVAGKGGGVDDPRHLWPHFHRLIRACRPPVVVGEQVAGSAGYGWLDGVRADLAGEGYASRGVDIPACAVDAPHLRQRLYWCALDNSVGDGSLLAPQSLRAGRGSADVADEPLADARSSGPGGRPIQPAGHIADRPAARRDESADRVAGGDESPVGDAFGPRLEGFGRHGDDRGGWQGAAGSAAPPDGSFWRGAAWLPCHDGKVRRIPEPGFPLLAHGVQARVAKWRGLGNAIVPQLAAEVLGALMDVTP